ncbi:MAG TPA: glycine zipper 2TM domain-containing protein [Xanthomonadaceae bacterium]|nr:glycine zipper 2TM domain-containing protein [Xanthomonadaceae bacterium]
MRIASLAIASAALVFASGVDASPRYDWARVVRAEPIVETYRVPVSHEVCRSEPVTVVERGYRRSDNRGPALLGAVVGGVIGNQFGKGSGRDAATAAGAVIGYQAVRSEQKRHDVHYGGGSYTTYRDACRIETHYQTEQRVVGYDVTYRYRGSLYRTRTDHHPGDRIRVRSDVRAVRY